MIAAAVDILGVAVGIERIVEIERRMLGPVHGDGQVAQLGGKPPGTDQLNVVGFPCTTPPSFSVPSHRSSRPVQSCRY